VFKKTIVLAAERPLFLFFGILLRRLYHDCERPRDSAKRLLPALPTRLLTSLEARVVYLFNTYFPPGLSRWTSPAEAPGSGRLSDPLRPPQKYQRAPSARPHWMPVDRDKQTIRNCWLFVNWDAQRPKGASLPPPMRKDSFFPAIDPPPRTS